MTGQPAKPEEVATTDPAPITAQEARDLLAAAIARLDVLAIDVRRTTRGDVNDLRGDLRRVNTFLLD